MGRSASLRGVSVFMVGNALTILMRALVPVIGVVFLNWSAPKLLVIYLADTAAAYYVLLAALALARSTAAPETASTALHRLARAVLVPIPTLLLIGAFFGILPLFVMMELQEVRWGDLLMDANMWWGVALQFALALSAIVHHSYRTGAFAHAAANTGVQSTCITVRWLAMIVIGFFLAPGIPRIVYGPLLIAVYSLSTAAIDLAPYRVVDWARRIAGAPLR